MKSVYLLGAILMVAVVPASADAAELFGGVHVHDVKTPLDASGLETGFDLSVGVRGNTFGHLFGGALQPYIFGALNTAGNTSYGAVGLDAKFRLGGGWYFRPGVGLAIHNGSAGKYYRTDRIAFGSRVLFEPEIGIGTQVTHNVSVEASWVHMSHAQLFGKENPGIDNLGMRLNLSI